MRLSLIEGGLVQVFLNWTSGSVIIGYLLSLGASPTHIALVGSVPFLAQVASPLVRINTVDGCKIARRTVDKQHRSTDLFFHIL